MEILYDGHILLSILFLYELRKNRWIENLASYLLKTIIFFGHI